MGLLYTKVVCAIIENEDSFLIAQRSSSMSNPLKWEFPGGKVKADESLREAIIRECNEELNIDVKPVTIKASVRHIYPHINIELVPVLCKIVKGDILLSEHAQCAYVPKVDLLNFDLSEADKLIVHLL